MRFQSTFRVPPRDTHSFPMTSLSKEGQGRQITGINKVLEACGQLRLPGADPATLRNIIAETAREIAQAAAAGMFVSEGEDYVLGSVSIQGGRDVSKSALVSQAKPFAI